MGCPPFLCQAQFDRGCPILPRFWEGWESGSSGRTAVVGLEQLAVVRLRRLGRGEAERLPDGGEACRRRQDFFAPFENREGCGTHILVATDGSATRRRRRFR